MLAVFYFTYEPAYKNIPKHVWVVVGDLPPAYIDVQDNPNGALAIEGYVMEMEKWVNNVLQEKPVDKLIPVNVPPEKKYAKALQNRLKIIKEEILATFENELAFRKP